MSNGENKWYRKIFRQNKKYIVVTSIRIYYANGSAQVLFIV